MEINLKDKPYGYVQLPYPDPCRYYFDLGPDPGSELLLYGSGLGSGQKTLPNLFIGYLKMKFLYRY